MSEGGFPSWYCWQPEQRLMPVDPPPMDAPDIRAYVEAAHRRLMEEAAERLGQLAGNASWLMVPDSEPPDDGICTVTMAGIRCTRPRSWHIWAGCAQEHMVEGYMCEHHLAETEAEVGTHWCAGCRAYNQAEQDKPEDQRSPQVAERWMIIRKEAA